MPKGKINLFLAGSPMEIISGLACIAETKPNNPVFLIERSINANSTGINMLLEMSAKRHPDVAFHFFTIARQKGSRGSGLATLLRRRIRWIKNLRSQINKAVQDTLNMTLDRLGDEVACIHFTYLSDYGRVLLGACWQCPRALYPHGFEHPRKHQIRDEPHLYMPRGILTAIRSLPHVKGRGELLVSILYRLCCKRLTCLPYDGTDVVYTFRQSPLNIKTKLIHLHELKTTFQWLTSSPPWKDELAKACRHIAAESVVILLSEYQRNPIWEENRNWAEAHLNLARATLRQVGSTSLVIKAHPRSDGEAAAHLHQMATQAMPDVTCHLLDDMLYLLPIEALAMGLEISAACSLGSCSLPSDIGINVPHYTSSTIARHFDKGWVGEKFWLSYENTTKVLEAEGICIHLGDH